MGKNGTKNVIFNIADILFERTHTHYEHTEYASIGVRTQMESIGTCIPNRR